MQKVMQKSFLGVINEYVISKNNKKLLFYKIRDIKFYYLLENNCFKTKLKKKIISFELKHIYVSQKKMGYVLKKIIYE